jgi:hypothetical protein
MRNAQTVIVALLGGLSLWLPSCLVEPHCRTDDDCAAPAICTAAGLCALECRTEDDCGLADLCVEHRCRPAPGCAGCRFDNALAVCVHGDCQMGRCLSGWHDLDGAASNGCESFCVPSGEERCNERDDDCNGLVDESFDLERDPLNCGQCGHVCPRPPNAVPRCDHGRCGFDCEPGWYDNDGRAENGCEDEECLPEEEVCDGRDNDCDGEVDEGFDKTLPESCGELCVVCEYPNAVARCVDGRCAMGPCEEGWHDLDGRTTNGCEYACTPTGEEVCDGRDNDCDGAIDEGLVCCPDDMVLVDGLFCLDRYEASLEALQGGGSRAVSVPRVLPYWRRDLTAAEAEAWCQASGKRLCNAAEWTLSCHGPNGSVYCYGDTYEPTTCNGIDAFGSGSFHLAPTGSFEACVNAWGAFDVNGNVWEMTADGLVRGGAYNCIDSAALHRCDFSIDPSRVVAIGFRCCM